jgi:hypothetical protein
VTITEATTVGDIAATVPSSVSVFQRHGIDFCFGGRTPLGAACAVFPLGIYTVCTLRLAYAIDAPYLLIIPRVFLYVVLAAWTLAMIGLVYELIPRRPRGPLIESG